MKTARRACVTCRRNRAKPGEQYMANPPESCLDSGSLPFKHNWNRSIRFIRFGSLSKSKTKRWGVLNTCMVTRAILYELIPSLFTSGISGTSYKYPLVSMAVGVPLTSNFLPGSFDAGLPNYVSWNLARPASRPWGSMFRRQPPTLLATKPTSNQALLSLRVHHLHEKYHTVTLFQFSTVLSTPFSYENDTSFNLGNRDSSNADSGQRFIPSRELLPFRTAYLRIFLREDFS
ncbi:hypothetical protein OUZ56_012496 [Daphnia magna]|uniref:Uncharacterized protein n=1 Tax=Daphnia magna TaxID=35525 RepID=A0ABQ9Z371_9CRUS|nr:hypothetical protein OUZ56_012496 [Daphnia magna]